MNAPRTQKSEASSIWHLRPHWKALTQAPRAHLRPIDGLRALSILLVFAFHLIWCAQVVIRDTYVQFQQLPPWVQWLKSGAFGVEAFFLLSGFLIGRLLILEFDATKDLQFKRFYVRRFLRLMPAYFIAIASAAIGSIVYPGPSQVFEREMSTNVENLWTNLLYINNFWPVKEQFLSHTWSLAVEEQFYFIAPVLLLFMLRRQLFHHLTKVVVLTLVAYIGSRFYFLAEAMTLMQSQCSNAPSDLSGPMLEASLQIFVSPLHDCVSATEFGVLYDNLYTRFLGFVVGIAAALLHVRHAEALRTWFYGSKLCIPITILATLAVLYPFAEQFLFNDTQIRLISSRIIAHPMLNFGLGFWILSLLHGSGRLNQWTARLLSSRPLYVIAQLSYSMYLFHILIILGVYQGLVAQWSEISIAMLMLMGGCVALPLTLLISAGVYLFVERPGIALRGRLPQR
ncbi:MAG: acyltransferase [Myxococcota bacterium]|nr:acyltransferase [Myxococcota bacterium]